MADYKAKAQQKLKAGETGNVVNEFFMRRSNLLIQHGVLFQIAMKHHLQKVYKYLSKFKKYAKDLELLLEKLKKKEIEQKEAKKIAKGIDKDMKEFLKMESEEAHSFRDIMKDMQTIGQNELEERRAFVFHLKGLIDEGIAKSDIIPNIKHFYTSLKHYSQDLQQIKSTYATLAGLMEGFMLNRTVTNLQTILRSGRIHMRWFMWPWERLSNTWAVSDMSKRLPKHVREHITLATKAEEQGDAKGTISENNKVLDTFDKENIKFEDVESDLITLMQKFIREELEVNKLLNETWDYERHQTKRDLRENDRSEGGQMMVEIRKLHSELARTIGKFRQTIENKNHEFARVLRDFRVGAEKTIEGANIIIHYLEDKVIPDAKTSA